MTMPPDWTGTEQYEFVTLIAGGQSFCIEITQIREIRRWTPVTVLPHAPESVLGVMNLRGAVIPIIDLAARLGFGRIEPGPRHVVIIVALAQKTVGLLVDAVSEIITIRGDMVRETPVLQDDAATRFIQGVIALEKDMTRIVDLGTVIPTTVKEAA